MSTHIFPADAVHFRWDPTLPPVLEVVPGDTVAYELRDVTDAQLAPTSTSESLSSLDWDRIYALAGPLAVRGAEPGDTLEIEVLDLRTGGWGWTAVLAGFGLLAEDFPDAYLHIWDLSDALVAGFQGVAKVPIRPFCGTMGVAPVTDEPLAVMPPGHFGGNIDCRDVVVGSRLRLPVQVNGAMFSVGDPHAAQGDGEVCVSAVECPMSATLRFHLHKGKSIPAPQLDVPGSLRPGIEDKGWYATMGVRADLMEAAKDAVRAMIDHVCASYKLDAVHAYLLCSVAVDLKVTEVVDAPNWVVSAYLPKGIFG